MREVGIASGLQPGAQIMWRWASLSGWSLRFP